MGERHPRLTMALLAAAALLTLIAIAMIPIGGQAGL
jgi:hypothetical protein